MIIKSYKGYVSLEELRYLTHTSKDGTNAYHIIEAANRLGFKSKGVRVELESFSASIILPCIASVTIDKKYKHFVVIHEINYKKKFVIIADPASKLIKMTFNQFKLIYNGVLIILYPITTIPYKSTTKFNINFVLNILKTHKPLLRQIIILSFFVTLFSILSSFFTEYMINGINDTNEKEYLLFLFLIFLIFNILKIISDYFRGKILILVNQKIDLTLTLDIFNKILLLPYRYYRNKTTGDIISRINDLGTVKETISKVILTVIVDIPLCIAALILLYMINELLFLISLIILLFYILILCLFKNSLENCILDIQSEKALATSYMVESISGFETVKGLHLEKNISQNFEGKYVRLLSKTFKFQNIYEFQSVLKESVNIIGFLIITFVGCILVIDSKITIGNLLTFNTLIIYFLDPIRNIVGLDGNIKESVSALKRVVELDIKDNNSRKINDDIKGDIEFKNLSYSFNNFEDVLKSVNLKIKENSKVAITGTSGSGKSTLLKILMKYYNVDRGHVFVNDIDINDLDALPISYINQTEILFTDTLKNNITQFRDIDNNEFNRVVQMCCVDEIVNNNLGYNMLIEENGFNLSGGERQRIILARALISVGNILIIDEGLNQADISLERKILSNLFQYYKDKTIIVITHRLDNIDLFDDVIELKNGVIYD